MEWFYLYLYNGRLVDEVGQEANTGWPTFRNDTDADDWLTEQDIRATCVGNWRPVLTEAEHTKDYVELRRE